MTEHKRYGPGSMGGTGGKSKNAQRMLPADVRSLARAYTKDCIRVLSAIMRDETNPAMARNTAAKILLDRGWGKPTESHHIDVNGDTTLLKVVNEIVHVHETREQIEFRDQTPLLELTPEDADGESKKTH